MAKIIISMVLILSSVMSVTCSKRTEDVCILASGSCDECIQMMDCVWCTDVTNRHGTPSFHRCQSRTRMNESCFVSVDPRAQVSPLVNSSLKLSSDSTLFIQMSPQHVEVRSRVDEWVSVDLSVGHAQHYPVDIYFLMDLSNSMANDRDTVASLSRQLSDMLLEITTDYRIGFGSFVDKEVLPFTTHLSPDAAGENEASEMSYVFRHSMSLERNLSRFQTIMENAEISGNVDNPEAGLESLVQVMSCTRIIGWRDNARRIVVFVTDQTSHIAGDGKLAGILTPNDGNCHLDETTGHYSASLLQDYPSIAQVNFLAKKQAFNIIWAVTPDQVDVYRNMADFVQASKTAVLNSNSSNLMDLLRRQLESISATITVWSNVSDPDLLETDISTLDSRCNANNECEGVVLGSPIHFKLNMRISKCFNTPQTIHVLQLGLQDKLTVDVEAICKCNCTTNTHHTCSNPQCNYNGKLVCGQCECCKGHFGPNCECQNYHEGDIDINDVDSHCRAHITDPLCSDRGRCVCGKCVCSQPRPDVIIRGQFCQDVCDNSACPRNVQGHLCSGHGRCSCGQCECEAGFVGINCECELNLKACMASNSSKVCSDKGVCECDHCQCTVDGYSGRYCEECTTCDSDCQKLRGCVECHIREGGQVRLGVEQQVGRSPIGVHVDHLHCDQMCLEVSEILELDSNDQRLWQLPNCSFLLHSCHYFFSHHTDDKDKHVLILHVLEMSKGVEKIGGHRFLECVPPPDVFGSLLLGMTGVVISGLITLLTWKLLVSINDRREVALFEDESQRVRFAAQTNPIFRQATTTVQNPTFISQNQHNS